MIGSLKAYIFEDINSSLSSDISSDELKIDTENLKAIPSINYHLEPKRQITSNFLAFNMKDLIIDNLNSNFLDTKLACLKLLSTIISL